jgi:hypothetical protein
LELIIRSIILCNRALVLAGASAGAVEDSLIHRKLKIICIAEER